MMVKNEKAFLIGDIHGCYGLLKRMMDIIHWSPERDALIFLGDYVDRGRDSKGVIDLVLETAALSPHVHCLLGNHEAMFLGFISGRESQAFLLNGGDATLESYRNACDLDREPLIPKEHMAFLKSLHPWIELEDYYVVHAGFRPGVDIHEQTIEDMTWIRDPFLYSDYDFKKRVIFGHTPFAEPLITATKIGLDTGAVYGNKLTCLEIPSMTFHTVEARFF